MRGQMRLFHEQPHYEPDCFLSGTPDIPDPLEVPILYDTWKDKERERQAYIDRTLREVGSKGLENVIFVDFRRDDYPEAA